MEMYKSFGILSFVVLWSGLIFMIRKWPGNRSMSYSSHAAATKSGSIYYFAMFSLHLALFYTFIDRWFVPTFQLPNMFLVLSLAAVFGQFVAVCVPTTGGRKTTIHDAASYVAFTLLIPLSVMIAVSPNVTMAGRIAASIAATFMTLLGVSFVFVKATMDHFIIFQTLYAASFHVALLVAIYVR